MSHLVRLLSDKQQGPATDTSCLFFCSATGPSFHLVLKIQAGDVKVRQHLVSEDSTREMLGLSENYNNPMLCVCVCDVFLHIDSYLSVTGIICVHL